MVRCKQDADSLDVIVIGAGVIGLASAVALLQAGHRVRVFDREGPGAGTSYGNAGSISVGSVAPNAHPGLLWHLPGWLLDPLSPVSIRLRYLVHSLPWLVKHLHASCHPGSLARTAAGLAPLMRNSITGYRQLLEPHAYERLIRVRGKLLVSTRLPSSRESVATRLRREHGITVHTLDATEIKTLEPALSNIFRSGLWVEQDGHTVDTMGVVYALAERVEQYGGHIEQKEIIDFDTRSEQTLGLVTPTERVCCDRAVVATGAWSSPLVSRLGDRVPLESERGYHAMLPDPGVRLSRPVGHMERHFYVTSLNTGLRVAGTAEIAGLNAPPNYRRAEALLQHACTMLPDLNTSRASYWMGHRPSMPDALPVIDQSSRDSRVIYAFGHGHLGLTLAPGTARLVADIISKSEPSIEPHPYRVSRF